MPLSKENPKSSEPIYSFEVGIRFGRGLTGDAPPISRASIIKYTI